MKKNDSAPQPAENQSCQIVGIGASAGGLQALLQLFENLPATTGMAYIVIQHLDAKNASALAGILTKATPMAVGEAKDQEVVRLNHVYVIAPGTELTVSAGILNVAPQRTGPRRHTPIDSFLESLAADKGGRAIGVILSGNGADGSQGVQQIKAVGGITFVQDPQSAEHDSMPLSAVATGMVDFILPPAEIAGALARVGQSRVDITSSAEADELFFGEADAMARLLGLLHKSSGVNFAEYKQLTIKRRVARRMLLLKIDKLDDYIGYLRQKPTELAALQQDMLINVTKFFREPQAFDALKNVVFPSIVGNAPANSPIRLWVPGCSTGEEAYSLAISLSEYLEEHAVNRTIQIFATDINETVITRARTGIYPKTIMTDISRARLSRFFDEVAQGYQVSKTIRDLCVFARQDIGKNPPISKVDLISCRNVMIYFGAALQKRMFPIFHYALNPGGFLLLGASESIGLFANLFDLVDKKYRIYAKKAVATPPLLQFAAIEHEAAATSLVKNHPVTANTGFWAEVQKEADRIIVSKYAPPGVIINSKFDILHFRGRTGAYLEPAAGVPSVNLMKMARDGLFLGLRAAVNQAKAGNTFVRKEGLSVVKNGQTLLVDVDVVPLSGSFPPGEYFLVLFKDTGGEPLAERKQDGDGQPHLPPAECSDELTALNQELIATKEYLQSIIDHDEAVNEDLRLAYEEIQSSNEELQSMNEEMETAKEELQSTNEELMTLNEELRTRNLELGNVNNDMLNLLRSISIPVLILSSDLRIRRFNSVAEKLLNLISADVGRPINNIKPNIDILDLEQLSLEVIDTLNSKEQEVQDRWGHWYSMQIRPYKTSDNKIDGVIIAFANIDVIKRSVESAREAGEFAEAIVETVRHPLLVLDSDLRLKTANRAFYQTFRVTPDEVNGLAIFQAEGSQWAIPQLRPHLEAILAQDTAFEDFEFSYDFPDTGRKTLLISGRRLVNSESQTKRILLAFEPVAPTKAAPA